jgi:hypothetical protein
MRKNVAGTSSAFSRSRTCWAPAGSGPSSKVSATSFSLVSTRSTRSPKNWNVRALLTFHRPSAATSTKVRLTAVMIVGLRRNHFMRSL